MANQPPEPFVVESAIWDPDTQDVAYILTGVKTAEAGTARLLSAAPQLRHAAGWALTMLSQQPESYSVPELRQLANAVRSADGLPPLPG